MFPRQTDKTFGRETVTDAKLMSQFGLLNPSPSGDHIQYAV